MIKKYTLFIIIVLMLFQPIETLFAEYGNKIRICAVKGTVQTGNVVKGDHQSELYHCPLKQTMNQTECKVVNQATMVETGFDSYAILEYRKGYTVKIGPNTKIVLETGTGNIYIYTGSSFFKVTPTFDKKGKTVLEVRLVTAIAGIRGTEFLVEVADDGTSTFSLIEGKLEVSDINKQKTVMLTAGMEVIVRTGLPPSNPTPLSVIGSEKWWTDWPTLIPISKTPSSVSPNFSNAVGKPCESDKEFVRSLYQSVLERDLEVSFATGYGEAHMRSLQDGNSRLVTIQAFFNSPEYLNKQKSGQEFIRDAYQAVLGREPSTNESNQWPRIDRNEIIKQLFNSIEYRNLISGCPEIGQQTAGSFSMSGHWQISQNNGIYGTLNLKQNQVGQLTGTAQWSGNINGTISGTVTGNSVSFTISYPSGIIGNYTGTLTQNGLKISNGISTANNGATATWEASKITPNLSSMSGHWQISQNNGIRGTLDLQQNQVGLLTGTAQWSGNINGTISGTISGNSVSFTISYPSGIIGNYTGTLTQNGLKISNGISTANNGATATWEASR